MRGRRSLLVCAIGTPQVLGFATRLCEASLGLREGILRGTVLGRQDGGHEPARLVDAGGGRGALIGDAGTLTRETLCLALDARPRQLDLLHPGTRLIEPLAEALLVVGPSGERACPRGCGLLGLAEGCQGSIRFAPGGEEGVGMTRRLDLGRPEPRPRRIDERLGKLHTGRRAGLLLLGLGCQASGLGPQLGQQVAHALQVRARLVELCLRTRTAALVLPDASRLLEERAALLGPQREGLVDHALPDEEEGVIGQVGVVEQLDQVTQADALAVQEVLVLARAEEPTAELDLAEIDREQPVAVVDDEADVGHAHGAAIGAAREDEVLGPSAAKSPTLLAERPAQPVGEVRLAAAVGAHDRGDAGAQLDDGALRERLEADQSELAESGPAHVPGPAAPGAAACSTSSGTAFAPRPVEGLQGPEGDLGGHGLRFPAVATLAHAQDGPVHGDLDDEVSVVVGSVAADDAIAGWASRPREGAFLQAALGRLQAIGRDGSLDLGTRGPEHERLGSGQSTVEIDGGHDGLEEAGQHRATGPLAGVPCALPQHERLPDAEAPRDAGETARRDDGRAAGGEDALGFIGMPQVEDLGDDEREHGVPEELESLVGLDGLLEVLVDVAAVDERDSEERGVVERQAESIGELDRARGHRPRSKATG